MAATLALRQTQSLLSFSPFKDWVPLISASSLMSIPSLFDLFPPFLLAVPKSKTSHSRKAMRSANKGLKDKQNITNCAGCGSVKLAHHICPQCYSSITRAWKAKKNKGTSGEMS